MADEAKKYTVISLFSGAGGIDIGLHQTGRFRTLATVEFMPQFCETLKANRERLDNCEVIHADLSKYDPQDLMKRLHLKPGDVDLLVGGPPCQSFSTAGKRGGLKDPRGQLIYAYLNFVLTLRPKMFLFENVRGFVEFPVKSGKRFIPLVSPYVREFMKDGMYNVQGWLLNAKNFGSPQSRERIFLIGNRLGCVVKTPHAEFGPPEVVASGHCKPWRTLRDAIGDLKSTPDEIMEYPPSLKPIFELIPKGGGNWKDLPAGHPLRIYKKEGTEEDSPDTFWRRLRWDQICPTVTTRIYERSPGFCHPTETRPLSIREAARIQGFPDDWVFCGNKQQKYKQVGNAVPSPLAAAAGLVIAAALDRAGSVKTKKEKWKGVFQNEWKKGKLRSSLVGIAMPGGGNPLSEVEKKDLITLEKQVRKHLATYMECGSALKRIQIGKLYRETHKTFEAYCNAVFALDRSRAYQYIRAVEATENVDKLSTNEERPINEGQVRPLSLLENAKDQAKAWDEAVQLSRMDGKERVTGAIVERVVFEMLHRGKKPADRILYSLMGTAIELKDPQPMPPFSVVNTFNLSSNDLESVLTNTNKLMEDKVICEGERSYILNEVRANAEKVIATLERLPPPKFKREETEEDFENSKW